MVRKRLVVSLLWRNGVIVQSVGFRHTNVVGDPKVAIEFFNAWDADEIVLLDVTRDAGRPERFLAMLHHVSKHCFLPLTAGGWVADVARAQLLLENGADKVVVNTRGFDEPAFLGELADKFGAQCVVASIDVRGQDRETWQVAVDRGRRPTGVDPVSAARRAAEHGAGEILLTSIDQDGSLKGYDLDLVRTVADAVDIPVIAFGGVGDWRHLKDGIDAGADAVAAGNIFHFTEQSTRAAKTYLIDAGAPVRPR